MKARLHEPTGKHRYCGPTALSAITGLSKDTIAELARHVGGRAQIKGMFNREAVGVLGLLGAEVRPCSGESLMGRPSARMTLTKWMQNRPESLRNVPLLVNVTNHFVAVCGDTVICSIQGGNKSHYISAACAKRRVLKAWAVDLPAKVKIPAEVKEARATKAAVRAQVKRMTSASYGKAKVLASKLGISIEMDDSWGDGCVRKVLGCSNPALWQCKLEDMGYVEQGADLQDEFYNEVMGGEAIFHDWDEVLNKLQRINSEFFTH